MAFLRYNICNSQNIRDLNSCFAVFFHPLFVAFCTPLKPKIGQKEPFFWHFPPFYSTKKTEFCNPFVTLLTFINVTLFCNPFCNPFAKKTGRCNATGTSVTTTFKKQYNSDLSMFFHDVWSCIFRFFT